MFKKKVGLLYLMYRKMCLNIFLCDVILYYLETDQVKKCFWSCIGSLFQHVKHFLLKYWAVKFLSWEKALLFSKTQYPMMRPWDHSGEILLAFLDKEKASVLWYRIMSNLGFLSSGNIVMGLENPCLKQP